MAKHSCLCSTNDLRRKNEVIFKLYLTDDLCNKIKSYAGIIRIFSFSFIIKSIISTLINLHKLACIKKEKELYLHQRVS